MRLSINGDSENFLTELSLRNFFTHIRNKIFCKKNQEFFTTLQFWLNLREKSTALQILASQDFLRTCSTATASENNDFLELLVCLVQLNKP
jgi:hypothetical protein